MVILWDALYEQGLDLIRRGKQWAAAGDPPMQQRINTIINAGVDSAEVTNARNLWLDPPEFPAKVTRGQFTLTANNEAERTQLQDFLGIDPPGNTLLKHLRNLNNVIAINQWRTYWNGLWDGFNRSDLKDFTNEQAELVIKEVQTGLQEGQVIEEDDPRFVGPVQPDEPEEEIIGPIQPDSDFKLPKNEELKAAEVELQKRKDELKELENGDGGLLNKFLTWRKKNEIEGWEEEVKRIGRGESPKILYGVIAIGGGGLAAGLAGGATTAGGAAAGAGTAGGAAANTLLGQATSAAGQIMGVDTLMVWLAQDNVLSGLSFTVRKLTEAFKAGVRTKKEVDEEIIRIKKWQNIAEKLVRVSAANNPLLIPFKEILLANVDKSLNDVELEISKIEAIAREQESL